MKVTSRRRNNLRVFATTIFMVCVTCALACRPAHAAKLKNKILRIRQHSSIRALGCGLHMDTADVGEINISCAGRTRTGSEATQKGVIYLRTNQRIRIRAQACYLGIKKIKPKRIDVTCGAAAPSRLMFATVPDANTLLRFDAAAPSQTSTIALSELAAGETIVGVDFRPSTGQLFGIGAAIGDNKATLYRIDPDSGVATAVGGSSALVFPTALNPFIGGYGFNFDPVSDQIRFGTAGGLNIRIDPDTGLAVDADGNPSNGITPDSLLSGTSVSASSYTNSVAGAVATSFYSIDYFSKTIRLLTPSSGDQITSKPLTLEGVSFSSSYCGALEIPSSVLVGSSNTAAVGIAYATFLVGTENSLYLIDLGSGALTRVGRIGDGFAITQGLAISSSAGS